MSVASLNCPVCSGPMTLGKERCDYCGSTIVIKTEMVKIDPKSLNQGVIHQHISEYRARLAVNPRDAEAHYGLGIAYFNLDLVKESSASLELAARLMPENPNIYFQLAQVLWHRYSANDIPSADVILPYLERAFLFRSDEEVQSLRAEVLKAVELERQFSQLHTLVSGGSTQEALSLLDSIPLSTQEKFARIQRHRGLSLGTGEFLKAVLLLWTGKTPEGLGVLWELPRHLWAQGVYLLSPNFESKLDGLGRLSPINTANQMKTAHLYRKYANSQNLGASLFQKVGYYRFDAGAYDHPKLRETMDSFSKLKGAPLVTKAIADKDLPAVLYHTVSLALAESSPIKVRSARG